MNDFVQTWWPVFVTVMSVAALAMAFWVNSQIDKKCGALNVDRKIDDANDVLKAEIGRVEKESDLKLNAALGKLYSVLNDLGDRTARIETRLDNLPHGKDVHEIALQCRDLIGGLKELRAELHGMRDSWKGIPAKIDRLEDFVIQARMEAGK